MKTFMAKKLSVSSRPAPLKRMRSEDIRNRKWTEGELRAVRNIARRQASQADSPISPGDIPLLSKEQLAAMVSLRDARRPKVAVSVRLDARVLESLKSKGEGHLTRINDILANLMEAESRSHRPS
jgi:uncharacterized protein (DUF4415 family)